MTTRKLQLKRKTESEWITENPVLSEGEPVYVTDTKQTITGDGVSNFTTLLSSNMIKDYQVIEPLNNNHQESIAKVGAKIGRNIQGTNIYYPMGLYKYDGKFYLGQYYNRLIEFDDNYNLTRVFNEITYQAPAGGDGIAYCGSPYIDDNIIILPSYGHHCVKVYDKSDGSLMSTIGVPPSAGHIADGKLYNPFSAILLSNGNVLVSSYNGYGESATNHGNLTEWDISTPTATVVSTRLGFTGNGSSAIGKSIVYRPMQIIVDKDDSNILWVSEYGRGQVLKVNMTTWKVEDILLAPNGISTIGSSYGICQMSDGTIVLASNSAQAIVGINPNTKDLVFNINTRTNQMRGLIEIEPGYIMYIVWGVSDQCRVVKTSSINIEYQTPNIPSSWELDEALMQEIFELDSSYTKEIDVNGEVEIKEKIIVPLRKI